MWLLFRRCFRRGPGLRCVRVLERVTDSAEGFRDKAADCDGKADLWRNRGYVDHCALLSVFWLAG